MKKPLRMARFPHASMRQPRSRKKDNVPLPLFKEEKKPHLLISCSHRKLSVTYLNRESERFSKIQEVRVRVMFSFVRHFLDMNSHVIACLARE